MRAFDRRIYARLLYVTLSIWAIAVVTVFYVYHGFKVVPPLAALTRWWGDLFTVAALGMISTAWGSLLLRWAKIQIQSCLERVVFGSAVGYGLLSTMLLILGLIGWLHKPIVWGVTLVLATAGLPEMRRLLQEWRRRFSAWSWPLTLSWDFETLLWFYLGMSLLLGLLLASVPPTSWDALIVHLVIPQEVLSEGRIDLALQKIPASAGRPILLHMLFTWGMALRGDTIPKLIHFSFAFGTVLAVYSMARKYLRCSPVLAATLFYMTPVVQLVAPWAYVDVGVTFYTVITLYALLNWLHNRETPWIVLTALLAAWSGQVKNNGWFIVVFTVGMIVYQLLRSGWPWRRRLRVFVLFGLIGVLTSLPWLVSNYRLGQQALPQARQVASKMDTAVTQTRVQPQEMGKGGIRLLALPWWMTMKGAQGTYEFDGEVGPLFLLFLPLWLLIWREEWATRILMLCVVTLFLLWLGWSSGGRLQNRLLMPIFPFLAILTARALEKLKEFTILNISPYQFMRLVVLLTLFVTLIVQIRASSAINPAAYVFGYRDRVEYLSSVLDNLYPSSPYFYSAMKQAEDSLPSSAHVGLLWPEKRVYYLPGSYVANPFLTSLSVEEMWEVSRELGLTHVLVGRSILEFERRLYTGLPSRYEKISTYTDRLDAFLKEHGRLLYSEHQAYEMYTLVESQW